MTDGFDPAQLLRRSWSSPDELAREIYVLLKAIQPPRPGAGSPRPVATHGGPPPVRPKSTTPAHSRPPVAAVPGRVAASPAAEAPGSSVQPWRPEHRPQAPPGPSGPAPAPAPTPTPTPPPAPAAGPPPAPAESTPAPPASPLVARASGVFSLARGALAESTPAPPARGVGVIPAVPRPGIGVAAPQSVASSYRPAVGHVPTLIQGPRPVALPRAGFDPSWFRNPAVLAHAGPGVAPDLRKPSRADDMPVIPTTATDPDRKATATQPWRSDRPRDWPPLGFDQKAFAMIQPAGVTAFKPPVSAGDQLGTPGKGQFVLLEYDGNVMTYGDSRDPSDVYNLGIFPIPGNVFWRIERYGQFFWADRQMFAHGIVSDQINPCNGTTPGKGRATVWYMSNGVMTAGPTLPVENWYGVTAAVGKHCGLVEVDGTAALEVLDC